MKSIDPEIILITNSVYPYHLHNVAVLSLPFGATYHFRYEHAYFEINPADISALKDKFGILVLRDFQRTSFIPLRTFRVQSADDCGDFVFLDLEFLHFIEYSASQSELSAGIGQHEKSLRDEREKYSDAIATQVANHKIVNNANQHLQKLILTADPTTLSKIRWSTSTEGGRFADSWSHVVTAIGAMPAYSGICFYLISNTVSLNSGKGATRFRTPWRAGLVLRTGKVYLIRVYQLMGNRTLPPKPGFKILLHYLETHLSPLSTELSVDGAYDRLSFFVSVLPQERETNQSELLFSCDQPVPDPADASKSSRIPGTPVQLKIIWPRWDRIAKWLIKPVLFVVGAALFVMADRVSTGACDGG